MPKKAIKNSTELEKVVHLGTQSKPLPRNLLKIRKKPKKRFLENPQVRYFLYETPKVILLFYETFLGFLRNLKRFRLCAQVKKPFKFRSIFYFFFWHLKLIWKLFPSTEPFW